MPRRFEDNTPEQKKFQIEVGQRIAQIRLERGLTQYRLAELSELTQQQVSYAERGEKGLRSQNLLKIAKALNVSADYLLTGEFIDKDINMSLSEIQEDLDQLSTEQRAIICDVVKLYIKAMKTNT